MSTIRKTLSVATILVALLGVVFLPAASAQVKIDSNTFGGLNARAIGPAVMGGRISTLDAVADDPRVIYAGAASGGVWKSIDGGIVWKPVFDDHPQSVGALTIDPSNSETIWVGTGEPWTRNSTSVGFGVYRSDDGGENWQNLGLEKTERISRILVDPTDSDTVYVCATGALWSANEERGVFKTTDGGTTWEKVLYVDDNTGCASLALDPGDPSMLYAGMWQFRRYPDFFESGGPGSGLYKSTDGGADWKEVRQGFPEGNLGRIAVEVAPSRPSTVYAVVEAKDKNAFFRSRDFGETWEERNAAMNIQMRPFYFSLIVTDPVDHDVVYKPGFTLSMSKDGGASFSSPFSGSGFGSSVHPDLHALWVNPKNTKELLLGTDGGLYQSFNRGSTWRHLNRLPLSQFYQVGFDMEFPYRVYGGLQDNGSWRGPATKSGGIQNSDWVFLNGGDGFHVYPDPDEANIVYAEYQGGNFSRVNLQTGEIQDIKPWAREGEEELRFNWNAPIAVSKHASSTIYVGSQHLHRSNDRGKTWETISPDLTTDDPARQRQLQSGGLTIDNSTAENNTTIFSIAESPKNAEVIWVGTDDGNVQVTRDGGANWTNVVGNIPGVGEGTWISQVEASAHDEATAFITIDDHRRGDMEPHVFETNDFGATWKSIVGEGIEGFAHVVRQDPVLENLLFVGTELGLFISLDRGQQWARFEGGIPPVPVHDLQIHPREHDLIVATHGRGIFILDDLSPLRALTPEILSADVALLPSRPAVMMMQGLGSWFPSDAEFVGQSVPESVAIFFYQKKRHLFGDLKVEILDQNGDLIISLPAGKQRGINRVDWAMRLKPPKMPAATNLVFAFTGPRVAEGSYKYRLVKGKKTLEGDFSLVADPRSPHDAEDRRMQQQAAMRLYDSLADLTWVVESLAGTREAAEARAEEVGAKSSLGKKLTAWAQEVEDLRASMVSTAEAGWLSGDEKLREKLGNLFGSVNNYEGKPTATQLEFMDELLGELESRTAQFETLTGDRLAKLNDALAKKGKESVVVSTKEEWLAAQEGASASSLLGVTKKELRRALGSHLTVF